MACHNVMLHLQRNGVCSNLRLSTQIKTGKLMILFFVLLRVLIEMHTIKIYIIVYLYPRWPFWLFFDVIDSDEYF